MEIEIITLLMFLSLFVLLGLGVPVAFALGAISIVFTIYLWGPQGLSNIPLVIYSEIGTGLLPIPLFLLMASVLERSGIADSLYEAIYRWTSNTPGGLAMGTVLIGTIFAAMSGVSGAATIAMGLVAIPSMLKRNYSKHLAIGSVAAGGVLGIVIPPSVIMIIYATVVRESVGALFFSGIVPGVMIALMHMIYIRVQSARDPHYGPPIGESIPLKEKIASLKSLILPIILIFTVLYVIYGGVANPTEAAGIGAFGAFVCAAVNKRLNMGLVNESIRSTLGLVCMIIWIVACASIFNSTYVAVGGRELIVGAIEGLDISPFAIIILMHVILFLMGMVMDDYAVVMLAAPIFHPVVVMLGFDPIWFGLTFILNKQMSYLTPPFGFTLFYLKGIVPKNVNMADIYRSVIPFVLIQALGLILVLAFPALATWLPSLR